MVSHGIPDYLIRDPGSGPRDPEIPRSRDPEIPRSRDPEIPRSRIRAGAVWGAPGDVFQGSPTGEHSVLSTYGTSRNRTPCRICRHHHAQPIAQKHPSRKTHLAKQHTNRKASSHTHTHTHTHTLERTPNKHMRTHAQTVRCLPLAYWLKGCGLADLSPACAPECTGLQCSARHCYTYTPGLRSYS